MISYYNNFIFFEMHCIIMIRPMYRQLLIAISNHYQQLSTNSLGCVSSFVNQPACPQTFQNQFMSIFGVVDDQDDQNLKQSMNSGTVKVLMEILQINHKSARSIVSKYGVFNIITKQTLMTNYEKLRTAGANNELVLDNITLLAQDPSELSKKVDNILKLIDNISDGSVFLGCDDEKINQILEIKLSIGEQILDVGKRFQISKKDMYIIILSYLHRMKSEPHGTLKKIELLLDHGASVDSLKEKEWSLKLSYQKLQARLIKFKQTGKQLKAYTLHYSEEAFERKLNFLNDRNEYSKQLTHLIGHLSEKSGYSTSLIRKRIGSFTLSARHNRRRIKFDEAYKIIDDILEEGYDYSDIINCLKILSLPRDLIKERFKMMESIESKVPSRGKGHLLDDLTSSDEEFVKYLYNRK